MKLINSFKIYLAFILTFQSAIAFADPIYRETFSFCGEATASKDAEEASAWYALVTGKVRGKVGNLKVAPQGAPERPFSVSSNPTGPYEGNSLWVKNIKRKRNPGLLILTEEFKFSSSDLYQVTYQQRIDGYFKPDPELDDIQSDASKLAFQIGNVWYISDQTFFPTTRHDWDTITAKPHDLTYGTTAAYPAIGPWAPQDSGKKLPLFKTITAFGLFFPTVNGRIRLDNFAISDGSAAAPIEVDQTKISCSIQDNDNNQNNQNSPIPTPSINNNPINPYNFCASGDGNEFVKANRKIRRNVLRSIAIKNSLNLRDKAVTALAFELKQPLSRLALLKVGDISEVNGRLYVSIPNTVLYPASKGLKNILRKYLKNASLAEQKETPLLRLMESENNYSTNGMCGSDIKRVLISRAKTVHVAKFLRFIPY